MRFRILLSISPLLLLTATVFAKPVSDSVGVENVNGKKVILHKVDPKETYFAIGRRYNIKPNLIIQFNNNVPLHPGMTVKVPTELPFAESTPKNVTQPPKDTQASAPASTQQYRVSAHETLYAISKRFGITVEELKNQNGLKSDILSPGQILNITSPGSQNKPETTPVKERVADNPPPVQQQQPQTQQPIPQQPAPTQNLQQQQPHQTPVNTQNTQQYKVSNGETLYTIAKRFNGTVDDIKALNNLTSDTLTPGQILIVRSGPPAPPPQPVIAKRDTTMVAPADSVERHLPANRYGLFEKNEKGPAITMDNSGMDSNKMLALHRTAPVGTVIKITNPMTNRSAYAKVVGSFTDNEQNKDAVIVITKNVADALGAVDKRFRVNITYGVPANEQ